MQRLDPKAIWLFFLQSLSGYFVLFCIIGYFYISLSGELTKALTLEENNPAGLINMLIVAFLIIVLVSLFLSFFIARLTYNYWKYELTEHALKIEKGIIWKKYISIPYDRIQNVDIYRGIFTRLLSLSDLQIQTAGYTSAAPATSEGRLPGLNQQTAEKLRDELIQKIKGNKQGL